MIGIHPRATLTPQHLLWVPAGALASFFASYGLGDRAALPVDLYYLAYFAIVIAFLALYVRRTGLDLRAVTRARLGWGIALGLVVGIVMVFNVLSRPATERLTGSALGAAVVRRGVTYGAVDGVLLYAFPWVVAWRALGAEGAPLPRRVRAALTAWLLTLLITTVYHFGYRDFRSPKIVQPNIGSAIMSVPTLVTGNPVASPITHVLMHVAAVLHSPKSELFLPPHRGPR